MNKKNIGSTLFFLVLLLFAGFIVYDRHQTESSTAVVSTIKEDKSTSFIVTTVRTVKKYLIKSTYTTSFTEILSLSILTKRKIANILMNTISIPYQLLFTKIKLMWEQIKLI